jgi:hypothetical protein
MHFQVGYFRLNFVSTVMKVIEIQSGGSKNRRKKQNEKEGRYVDENK